MAHFFSYVHISEIIKINLLLGLYIVKYTAVPNHYVRLIDLKIRPENILLAGDSAGGALSLALLMYLRDNSYPLPSGAILFSPWVGTLLSSPHWSKLANNVKRPYNEVRIFN